LSLARWALAAAVLVASSGALCSPAAAQSDAGPADGTCTVRVAAVEELGADGRLQAVVLEPTVTGAGTISGTVALFTTANRRFDLRFENASISSDAPLVLAYRFPEPVTISGAYLATLDTPQPGPCGIIGPWTRDTETDPRAAHAIALATPGAPANALPVADIGRDDPMPCRRPRAPARVLQLASPQLSFWTDPGSLPQGTISVRVLVGPDGHALDAQMDHVDGNINETAIGTAMKSDALVAAMHSRYAPETFRCRPIYGIAYYVLKLQPKQ